MCTKACKGWSGNIIIWQFTFHQHGWTMRCRLLLGSCLCSSTCKCKMRVLQLPHIVRCVLVTQLNRQSYQRHSRFQTRDSRRPQMPYVPWYCNTATSSWFHCWIWTSCQVSVINQFEKINHGSTCGKKLQDQRVVAKSEIRFKFYWDHNVHRMHPVFSELRNKSKSHSYWSFLIEKGQSWDILDNYNG